MCQTFCAHFRIRIHSKDDRLSAVAFLLQVQMMHNCQQQHMQQLAAAAGEECFHGSSVSSVPRDGHGDRQLMHLSRGE